MSTAPSGRAEASEPGPALERLAVALVASGCASLVAYVALRGLGVPWQPAVLLVVLLGAAGVLWLTRRLPPGLDGLRRRRPWLCVAWLILGLVSLGQTVRAAAFMLEPARPQHSLLPWNPWLVEHCCLTAYMESARLASQGDRNLYQAEHYRDRKLAGFNVDLYHYPPTFLLIPLGARAVAGSDFLAVRAFWFGLSGLALLLALGLLAWRLPPDAQRRALFTAPAIWCSIPAQLGLQMSNVQVLVVSISMIAWAVFPRRAALGGALLAMSIVAKIFPGILLVYLLARRRWREAAWTVVFAIGFCVLALAVLGPTPFRAFFEYELPRLSSGEAFARPFSRVFAVARNMSPFGIALKLDRLGVPGMTLEVGRILALVYGLAILAWVIRAAHRPPRSDAGTASVWLALLSLGTLVSPFAPANYVLLSLVWLVMIDGSIIRPALSVAIWLVISLPFLIPQGSPFPIQLIGFLPAQVLALGVPVLVLWRAGSRWPHDPTNVELRLGGTAA